ncbi:MAG: putative nitrogen fixation protein NifT [Rubrivivax sp.]|jgi:nitrogen fixation protein NifT|uniref:Nitrogen fixation protein NifT n=1 Tax=Rubrivivax benzoatilyticus TaxID=316997 RepID=A0ABX0HRW7_9BURK|nr:MULTISPECIES: putative nitrogen fixation protein NifT [Rubrivivax]MCD0420691.1 putative nitrogen fixation protein NifT [Rubrivivax sp. JA1024]MCC9595623.1 putative nitrogen fixation protein NifT [Rubrivivax sp. JA1055]MCC9646870.1 putative nitrogen fixation protein NifT [Rubrivivax sp. JA1029]NHK97799.1 putative nitrogen fixation protein NifT [Rubrivivax benzoatilyticus]NHL23301.1 putative nitrogen fixation protein NifT [Rubrivivax benzoatilyticus]
MKVMMRRNSAGVLSAYVPKKDLEEPVVAQEKPGLWGGTVTLANGWVLSLPEMAETTTLPITVEAKKLAED